MEIKVLLFGQLVDITATGSLTILDIKTTGDLMQQLVKTYPELQIINYLIAVNKKIIRENTALHHEDIVALLPPFSGG